MYVKCWSFNFVAVSAFVMKADHLMKTVHHGSRLFVLYCGYFDRFSFIRIPALAPGEAFQATLPFSDQVVTKVYDAMWRQSVTMIWRLLQFDLIGSFNNYLSWVVWLVWKQINFSVLCKPVIWLLSAVELSPEYIKTRKYRYIRQPQ